MSEEAERLGGVSPSLKQNDSLLSVLALTASAEQRDTLPRVHSVSPPPPSVSIHPQLSDESIWKIVDDKSIERSARRVVINVE